MHDNDYLASLACLWKNLVKLKFLVWFSWLVRHVLSSTSDPVEDLNFSGGSRRGAREARPSYFKTKLRPKGPKTNFFWDWAPPLLSQGLDDRPLHPSSLSESLHPPLNFIYVDPNYKLKFGSSHEKFDGCARPQLIETWMFIWLFIRILNRCTFTSWTSLSDGFHFLLAKCVIKCGVDRTWGRPSASVNYEHFHYHQLKLK